MIVQTDSTPKGTPLQGRKILNQPAERYIAQLRNEKKAQYARAYFTWLCINDHQQGPPEPPEGLSTMAAQAVRMTLRQWVHRTDGQ